MSNVVFRSLKNRVLRLSRWVLLLSPLSLSGCFESHSAVNQSNKARAGVASLARYFPFNQPAQPDKPSEIAALSQPFWMPPPYQIGDLQREAEEFEIATPSFIGADGNAAKDFLRVKGFGSEFSVQKRAVAKSMSPSILDSSFNQFFSTIFKQNKEGRQNREEAAAPPSKDESANPFTEARQKLESSSTETSSEPKADAAETKSAEPKQESKESKQESKSSNDAATGTGSAPVEKFMLVGDFAGKGFVSAISVVRSGDAGFISDDGERDLSLRINTNAVENQSSFCVEDINGDGAPDLLTTNRQFLFGGILLGDGSGGYEPGGTFPTWYRAMVPGVGPLRDGMRYILAVDALTGFVAQYGWQDGRHYRYEQSDQLPFLPDFLLRLVAPDTSEYLMAAEPGGIEQIMAWGDYQGFQFLPDKLGADPRVLDASFGPNSLQAYQVGNYASFVLNSNGKSFNVVNMRVMPGTFLVIGDFYRKGSLDVAVGTLSRFIPRKK